MMTSRSVPKPVVQLFFSLFLLGACSACTSAESTGALLSPNRSQFQELLSSPHEPRMNADVPQPAFDDLKTEKSLANTNNLSVDFDGPTSKSASSRSSSPAADTVESEDKQTIHAQPSARPSLDAMVRKSVAAVAMLSVLGIVCFLFHQWNQQKSMVTDGDAPLQLISSLAIAPRCSVSLLQARGNAYLVARDATGIKQIIPVQKDFASLVSEADSLSTSDDTLHDSLPRPWTVGPKHVAANGAMERMS